MQASPPPVPRMPEEYVYSNGNSREHLRTPSLVSIDESKPVIKEPRTPAEYALHTVFASFVISADHKVSQYLRYRLVCKITVLNLNYITNVDLESRSTLFTRVHWTWG